MLSKEIEIKLRLPFSLQHFKNLFLHANSTEIIVVCWWFSYQNVICSVFVVGCTGWEFQSLLLIFFLKQKTTTKGLKYEEREGDGRKMKS